MDKITKELILEELDMSETTFDDVFMSKFYDAWDLEYATKLVELIDGLVNLICEDDKTFVEFMYRFLDKEA